MTSREDAATYEGFTLIELVATLAVTAVVASAVYSGYRTHAVRAEVAAAAAAARWLQEAIAAAFRRSGDVAAIDTDHAVVAALRVQRPEHVETLTVSRGRIDMTFGAAAGETLAGRRLSLTPYETAAQDVYWLCGHEPPGPGLAPLGFAGGGVQAEPLATTIDARYLPAECRQPARSAIRD